MERIQLNCCISILSLYLYILLFITIGVDQIIEPATKWSNSIILEKPSENCGYSYEISVSCLCSKLSTPLSRCLCLYCYSLFMSWPFFTSHFHLQVEWLCELHFRGSLECDWCALGCVCVSVSRRCIEAQ